MFDDFLQHYGVKGMKWGIRRYQNPDGTRIYKNGVTHEKKITKDVMDVASKIGVSLYGLEHRRKSKESINRKINKKIIEKGMTSKDAADSIKDAVRFTTIARTDDFVQKYEDFKSHMKDLGYNESSCNNYFEDYRQGKVKHKAVQSTFMGPDGYEFEVQFQTPESQHAKDKKIPLYEERRSVGISHERAVELEEKMIKLAEAVPYPKDIERIKSHGN